MKFESSLSLILLVTLGCLCFLLWKSDSILRRYKLNAATLYGVFWSVVVGVFLLDIILYWPGRAQEQIQAILSGLSGASLGWILGIWISPMGQGESTKFTKYWTAIGVGSGVTLKWIIDLIASHYRTDLVPHWFAVALFLTACLITMAAVYNSRAYQDSLEIHVRLAASDKDTVAGNPVKVKAGQSCTFYAQVSGASDARSRWQVLPDPGFVLGTLDSSATTLVGTQMGTDVVFTAASSGEKGRIAAMNLEDPTLSNMVNVEVI